VRILYQTDGYLPDVVGGLEVFSSSLVNRLRLRGHEVLVVTSCVGDQPPGNYSYEGAKVVKLNFGEALQSMRLDKLAALQRDVQSVVDEFRPDVLHVNDARPSGFFFVRRGALVHLPRVLALHTPIRSTRGLLDRLMDDTDVTVAVSRHVADCVVRNFPAHEKKIVVVPNAVPVPKERPAPLPADRPVFLSVGRITEDKGADVAIEAVAMLRDEGFDADLIVAGDGPYRPQLESLVAQMQLGDRVRFRGWVSPTEMYRTLNQATIVLATSRTEEAFGLVALEAAWMGRPVIATRVGGLPEVVEHGRTGLLVPPGDPRALARAMVELVRTEGLVERFGRSARAHAEKTFDFASLVVAYEEAYETARRVKARARTAA